MLFSNQMKRQLISFAAIAAFAGLALGSILGDSVTLGTLDLPGGTTSSGNVDGNAVSANSNAISGTLCNKTNTSISDITVTVKRVGAIGAAPTFTGVAFENTSISSSTTPSATATGDGYTQTLNFATPVPNNGCKVFTIQGINCATDVTCSFTPSHSYGAGGKATLMTRYEFRTSTTSTTQTTEAAHDRVAFEVTNLDNRREIIGLSGQVTFLDGTGPSLSNVVLQDVQNGYAGVPGSSVTVTGNTFNISNFNPLDEAGIYWIVAVFTSNPQAGRVQVQLSPTYGS